MTNETKPKKLTKYQKKKQKEEGDKKFADALEKFNNDPIAIKNFFDSYIAPTIEKDPEKAIKTAKLIAQYFLVRVSILEKYDHLLNTLASDNCTLENFHEACLASNLEPEMIMLIEAIIPTAGDSARKALQEKITEEKKKGAKLRLEYYENILKPRAIKYRNQNLDKSRFTCATNFRKQLVTESKDPNNEYSAEKIPAVRTIDGWLEDI